MTGNNINNYLQHTERESLDHTCSGLPEPPDEEHDQPADPEPGGGRPLVPPGLRARHRQ